MKKKIEQMRVYGDPYHKSFSFFTEENKKLTSSIIRKLKKKMENTKNSDKKRELKNLTRIVETWYDQGVYLESEEQLKKLINQPI